MDRMGQAEIEEIFEILLGPDRTPPSLSSRRYRRSIEQLRTGRTAAIAGVARHLAEVSREGRLVAGEERLFRRAVSLLAHKVILVSGVPHDAAHHEAARRQILDALA
jgi:RNA polymerase-interacting CarD/CdnL/TRCF family regulator